jgi:hypothetical protein
MESFPETLEEPCVRTGVHLHRALDVTRIFLVTATLALVAVALPGSAQPRAIDLKRSTVTVRVFKSGLFRACGIPTGTHPVGPRLIDRWRDLSSAATAPSEAPGKRRQSLGASALSVETWTEVVRMAACRIRDQSGRRMPPDGNYFDEWTPATSTGAARYRSGKRRFRSSIFGRSLMAI